MNRILWHAIRYDIREGILKKFLYFLVLIAVILYFVVSSAMILSNTQGNCSVTDIFLYLWRGSPKPVLQRGQTFEIPIFYLFLHVLILFFACYYPIRELKTKGRILILFFRSRTVWWYGKCIWNFIGTFCIYFLFFVVISIVVLFFDGDFLLTREMQEQLDGILLTDNSKVILLYCFLAGYCVMLAMNQIQITLQLICPPVVGFLIMLSLLTASFCMESSLLLGNYLMLCRTELFENGSVNLQFGCLYALFIWILSIFAGKIIIERKDL